MIKMKHFVVYDYIRQINLTKGRRAKYYVKGEKQPERYKKARYIYRYKGTTECLYDTVGKKFLIRNEKSLDKPRTKIIAGNDLHSLCMLKAHRAMIMREIKKQFKEVLVKGTIRSFP